MGLSCVLFRSQECKLLGVGAEMMPPLETPRTVPKPWGSLEQSLSTQGLSVSSLHRVPGEAKPERQTVVLVGTWHHWPGQSGKDTRSFFRS